ncbi:hypothetical protein BOX15_Mlig000825g2 [Macrostomum lignano]|uniref:KY-like immunoglobulin-like domain-containing protein n=1 Tax=Macrostomum lignano TaxID=282301 RepID=A0A267DVL3_9PLAT|nr:hypothetical protein BOX15_Mlig000825g2 [Macrostomum lignano]
MRRIGYYVLQLFFKEFNAQDSAFSCLAVFLIECTTALSALEMFPDYNGFYGIQLNPKDFSFAHQFVTETEFFIKDSDGQCELKFPTTELVYAVVSLCSADDSADIREFSLVETKKDYLKVNIRMSRNFFYKLQLFCKPSNSNRESYKLLANFLIECTRPLDQPRQFPETYASFSKEQVSLESPRDGELSANSEVVFKLTSPTLKKLMVNSSVHSRTEAGFEFVVRTGPAGSDLTVYGSADKSANSYVGLCKYRVV